MVRLSRLGENFTYPLNFVAFVILIFVLAVVSAALHVTPAHAATPKVTQVSTGTATTCAVVDYRAKCWGDGSSGQLGNNSTNDSSTPVTVHSKSSWKETVTICDKSEWFKCTQSHEEQVIHPAEGLGGRSVTKISVGTTHACAIADARVFCWGKNDNGQLGNRAGGNWWDQQNTPVAVDIAAPQVKTCTAWYDTARKYCKTYNPSADRAGSALNKKEVIDISAGDGFTCALASDGTVACWGKNDNGQLGTGNRTTSNIPVAAATNSGSALNGIKVKKLALLKGNAATMCVITMEDKAVCWGQNYAGQVGDGRHGDDSSKVKDTGNSFGNCNGAKGTAEDYTGIDVRAGSFDALMPGLVQTPIKFDSIVITAGDGGTKGNGKSQNNNKTEVILDSTQFSFVSAEEKDSGRMHWWGGSLHYTTVLNCKPTHGAETDWEAIRTDKVTYNYTPRPVGAIGVQPITIFSGNVYPGTDYGSTFCALRSSSNTAYCDLHGASALNQGQAGNNYTPQNCVTKVSWGISTTTCDPDPTGPQPVYAGGWLAGKTITAIDTGFIDRTLTYTCVIASGELGCWGDNSYGQLGVGDKNLRKQATKVTL